MKAANSVQHWLSELRLKNIWHP